MPEDAPSYTALPNGSNDDDLQAAASNQAPDDEQSDESTVSDQESKKQQRLEAHCLQRGRPVSTTGVSSPA